MQLFIAIGLMFAFNFFQSLRVLAALDFTHENNITMKEQIVHVEIQKEVISQTFFY